jgi:heterodisulfide reductase subunit A-like polyferredoxin
MASSTISPAMEHSTPEDYGLSRTSGYKQPVWIATEPYSNRPQFPKLNKDVRADVVIVGSGITGVSVAYEAVQRGFSVAMIEARDAVGGESGRTSGHLSSALDDTYHELIKSMNYLCWSGSA